MWIKPSFLSKNSSSFTFRAQGPGLIFYRQNITSNIQKSSLLSYDIYVSVDSWIDNETSKMILVKQTIYLHGHVPTNDQPWDKIMILIGNHVTMTQEIMCQMVLNRENADFIYLTVIH